MYKKESAIILSTIMITALLASIGSVAAAEDTVSVSPTVVQADTRVKLTFTITNGTDENIENILIRPPAGTFTEAIGGKPSADNLILAADNLENAVTPLKQAGENLKLATDNIDSTASDLIGAGENLRDPVKDDWYLAAAAGGAGGENAENAWMGVEKAGEYLKKAGGEIDNEDKDFSLIADYLETAENWLASTAGADGSIDNIDGDGDAAGSGVDNAATNLGNAVAALRSGGIKAAGENLILAGENLKLAGDNLADEDATVGAALTNAGTCLSRAGEKLSDAGDYIADAGTNLQNMRISLVTAAELLENADDNLATAAYNLDNAAENIEAAGGALVGDDFVGAGDNLSQAADNLSTAATELGKVLGKEALSNFVTEENAAAENLNLSAANFTTAGDKLISASTYLESVADTIRTTANDLAPSTWSLTEGPASTTNDNDVLFSTIGENENWMQPGESLDFTFIWKSGAADTTFEIWGYKVGAGIDSPTFGPIEATVEIDSTAPSISVVVTQEGVAVENLVGTAYNNGKALITITADEVVDNLGPIELRDGGENLSPPITRADLTTSDNTVFTYEFDVGEWDDNSPVEVWIESVTDLYANENTSPDNGEFYVDTRAPIIIDNAIGTADLGLEEKVQAGTGNVYWFDNVGEKTLTGRAEDNWDGARLGYENDAVSDVITVDITYDGESVTASATPADNFTADVTLPEGLTSRLMIKAIDWTGNSENVYLDNILVDTTSPTIGSATIAGESYSDNMWVNDNTPSFSVSITDPNYPNSLGVWRDNISVVLRKADGSPVTTVENSSAWSTSVGTFENSALTDGAGDPLSDNTYYLEVQANDNFNDNSNENFWFKVDATSPSDTTPKLNRTSVNVTEADGTLIIEQGGATSTGITDKSTLTVRGTSVESGSTIKIYVKENSPTYREVGSTALLAGEDEWEVEITGLNEGTNELYLEETDLAGNVSDKVLFATITVDLTAPTITLSSDTAALDGTSTGDSSVTISATITDNVFDYKDIYVAVRATAYDRPETPVTLSADNTITWSVPLQEGSNTIDIIAQDDVNNTSIESITVTRTVTPWTMYAVIGAIIAIILAAIAIIRRSS